MKRILTAENIRFWSFVFDQKSLNRQEIEQKNENKTIKISCQNRLKTQYKQNIHVESIHEKKFERSLHAILLLHADFHRMQIFFACKFSLHANFHCMQFVCFEEYLTRKTVTKKQLSLWSFDSKKIAIEFKRRHRKYILNKSKKQTKTNITHFDDSFIHRVFLNDLKSYSQIISKILFNSRSFATRWKHCFELIAWNIFSDKTILRSNIESSIRDIWINATSKQSILFFTNIFISLQRVFFSSHTLIFVICLISHRATYKCI